MIYDELDQVIKISDKKYPKKYVNPKITSQDDLPTLYIYTLYGFGILMVSTFHTKIKYKISSQKMSHFE